MVFLVRPQLNNNNARPQEFICNNMASQAKRKKVDPATQVKTEREILTELEAIVQQLQSVDLMLLRDSKLREMDGKQAYSKKNLNNHKNIIIIIKTIAPLPHSYYLQRRI